MPIRGTKTEQLRMPVDLYGRAAHDESCVRTKKHDGASYVWLAYSVFFFITPILRHNLTYWLQQVAVYVVFLGLYVAYVEFESQRARLAVLAGIFALGVWSISRNEGGSCFFIYVAAMMPFCVERALLLWGVIGLEIAALAVENHLYPGNPFNYLISGFFLIVVGVSNLFVAQSKRADAKLRRAEQENIQLSAVAERERIARDLHDVLGHTLSVIVLKAELAGRLMGRDDKRAAAEIADVERTARTALAEVREAIGGYRSKGLQAEVDQARMTLDAAGVVLTCETKPPALKAREETVLSLAVREAVTNIVRHAHATECWMKFATTEEGFALLEIADNGSSGIAKEGNGLRGMRERVQELGGRFRIDGERGTRLVIELPEGQEQMRPDAGRAPLRGVLDASRVVGNG
jgi:two-component system, NarL family, sensor histidine kinase DesK